MFPSPVLSSGMNVSWYLINVQIQIGNVTFIWGAAVSLMLLYKVCIQHSVSDLLKRKTTGKAWVMQRAWQILTSTVRYFQNIS